MYEYIKGQLVIIQPTYIVVETNGIGFKILVPNPFDFQNNLKNEITCYVEQVVREDAHTLYGFKDLVEKNLFLTLNKVSGIGPKSALSILAANDASGLVAAIEAGDSQYLVKFPGVGKKTAQQMILDLKGEINLDDSQAEACPQKVMNNRLIEEVNEALIGLGYSVREVKRIEKDLVAASCDTTQEALSLAFKLLLKK